MAKRKLHRATASLRDDVTNNTLNETNKTKNLGQSKIDKKANSLISQEIKIARLLANNDKKVRDKVFRRMKKWLAVRSQDPSGKRCVISPYIFVLYNISDWCKCNNIDLAFV